MIVSNKQECCFASDKDPYFPIDTFLQQKQSFQEIGTNFSNQVESFFPR